MSNHHPPGSNPHGLPVSTPPPSTGPYAVPNAGGMPPSQYTSYPSATSAHVNDPYRTASVAASSSQTLPSMRTFDPVAQQRTMPHGAQHAFSSQASAHAMPYYPTNPMGINVGYTMPPDMVPARYGMPSDPRFMGHHRPGPKKVGSCRWQGGSQCRRGPNAGFRKRRD